MSLTSKSFQHRIQTIVHFKADEYKGGLSGCKRDEVQWRHPPDWSVVVWEWSEQICWWRLDLISDLWDLSQQSLSLFASLQAEWPPPLVSTTYTPPHRLEHGARIMQVHLRHCSRNSAERRGTPRRRACSWNSTDPGTAGLCWPQHAPVVPGMMRFY